jgi:hypothetical protein
LREQIGVQVEAVKKLAMLLGAVAPEWGQSRDGSESQIVAILKDVAGYGTGWTGPADPCEVGGRAMRSRQAIVASTPLADGSHRTYVGVQAGKAVWENTQTGQAASSAPSRNDDNGSNSAARFRDVLRSPRPGGRTEGKWS